MLIRDVSLDLQSLFSIKLLTTSSCSESAPELLMDLIHSGEIQFALGDFYKVAGATHMVGFCRLLVVSC